jgi:hypothetical protein
MLGIFNALRERCVSTAELKAVLANPKDELSTTWTHGGAADQALCSVQSDARAVYQPSFKCLFFFWSGMENRVCEPNSTTLRGYLL